ncbi:HU family DNA-binding protein [Parashewanella spongiae]|uniref:HU family DNA-binding protein n=1 Tax=Parashewanella spongiae TaxID=342950 RepID=A0A3A6U395_9GAMM|nr:HU family DNA-binding protein [Parashewanella spongiae]MCL1078770.1 HU family DNA-binding protein [Parashewanella spongiae]RJY07788.1 HU family DNA-binding protein [Parashewanella spongiae]
MNKSELIKTMANLSNASQVDTKRALNALLSNVQQALSEGEKVYLPQFGTFELRYHLPKQGRNPQTGELLEIDGYNQPSFKVSPVLKKIMS